MQAVILAGGLGTRLRPFTEAIPKPLLPVGGKAILQIQIERLRDSGFDEIFICTNYKSDYIEDFLGDGSRYNVNITVSREEEPLGTAGPLRLIEEEIKGPFLVMNGDILTLLDFSKFFDFARKSDADACLAIKKDITPFEFGNIIFRDNVVLELQEKPDLVRYILAGVYVLHPRVLGLIPRGRYFGMDTFINDLIRKDKSVLKYEVEEYWLDIGRHKDYEKAESDYGQFFSGKE